MIIAILRLAIFLYILAILAVIIFSWFPVQPGSPAHRVFLFFRRITDPVLEPVRRILPPVFGGAVDLSPAIVLFVLFAIQRLLPA